MPDDGVQTHPAADGGEQGAAINLDQLVEKVYRLLQAEIRLGRARGALVSTAVGWRRRATC